MSAGKSTGASAGTSTFSRRQVLGTVGAAAGSILVGRSGSAAPKQGEQSLRGDQAKTPCTVRVAAVSYAPPFHNHRKDGVNLDSLREMTAKVAIERPDFICYPEGCTCLAGGFEKGLDSAPDLDAHVAEVGKIAREFDTAIIAPFLERSGGNVYNSVPIVDRKGNFVMVYRKNFPTTGELEAGITPGHEVPVAVCDGIRVGAAVCFDANFDQVAMELERQRARLVFWPSMYWGGQLLQHWALRYGFSIAVAYGEESAIIDMNGEYLSQQGAGTFQVRRGHLPPWAVADVAINRELYHLDFNQDKLTAIHQKYGPDVALEVKEPEGYFLMASRLPDLCVEEIATEFELETLRDYLARSVKMRNSRLKT